MARQNPFLPVVADKSSVFVTRIEERPARLQPAAGVSPLRAASAFEQSPLAEVLRPFCDDTIFDAHDGELG